jgi:hypothetical protein
LQLLYGIDLFMGSVKVEGLVFFVAFGLANITRVWILSFLFASQIPALLLHLTLSLTDTPLETCSHAITIHARLFAATVYSQPNATPDPAARATPTSSQPSPAFHPKPKTTTKPSIYPPSTPNPSKAYENQKTKTPKMSAPAPNTTTTTP